MLFSIACLKIPHSSSSFGYAGSKVIASTMYSFMPKSESRPFLQQTLAKTTHNADCLTLEDFINHVLVFHVITIFISEDFNVDLQTAEQIRYNSSFYGRCLRGHQRMKNIPEASNLVNLNMRLYRQVVRTSFPLYSFCLSDQHRMKSATKILRQVDHATLFVNRFIHLFIGI